MPESAKLSDLLGRSLRPALLAGIGLAVFQQVTGINTVIYYAPLIIQSAGISSNSGAILATAGIGLVNVIMTVEKLDQKIEANVHLSGKDIHVQANDGDMYAAIDGLMDKLDRQVLKHKERFHARHPEAIKRFPQ